MNKQITHELIKTRKDIKRKLDALKYGEIQNEIKLQKSYKPVTETLKKISDNIENIKESNIAKNKKVKKNGDKNIPIPFVKSEYFQKDDEEEEEEEEGGGKDEKKEEKPQYSQYVINEYLDNFDATLSPYIAELFNESSNLDNTTGVYYDEANDKFYLGNKEIIFENRKNIQIDNKIFPGTSGLYNLIFFKILQNIIKRSEVIIKKF